MTPTRTCFVIMPFSTSGTWGAARWSEFFETELRPVVEEFGYQCIRSTATRGNIIKDIVNSLNSSHLVIADLTGLNYNVLYELGIRHSLSPRTIMLTQEDPADLPFDPKHYGCRRYSVDGPKARSEFEATLRELLKSVDDDPTRDDSPVADFVNIREQAEHDREVRQTVGMLRLAHDELRLLDSLINLADATPTTAFALELKTPALDALLSRYHVDNYAFSQKLSVLQMYLLFTRHYLDGAEEASLLESTRALARSLLVDVWNVASALDRGESPGAVEIPPLSSLFPPGSTTTIDAMAERLRVRISEAREKARSAVAQEPPSTGGMTP